MTVTLTHVAGPHIKPGIGVEEVFSALLDDSSLVTGEPIDVTAYFDYILSARCESVNALADAAYKYDMIIPAQGVAVTDANVLIGIHLSPAKTGDVEVAEPFDAADGANLSTVGELMITIVGKPHKSTTW
jgi:hypothetical protein